MFATGKKPNHYTVLPGPGSNVHSGGAVLWLECVENGEIGMKAWG